MEPLRDLGKSQWSSFTWGGLPGNHCEIWENLNGVPSPGGGGGLQENQTVVSKVQVTSTRMDQ